jgi:hypothetical protein
LPANVCVDPGSYNDKTCDKGDPVRRVEQIKASAEEREEREGTYSSWAVRQFAGVEPFEGESKEQRKTQKKR